MPAMFFIIIVLLENWLKIDRSLKLVESCPFMVLKNWLQPDENLVNTALGQSDEIVIGIVGTLPAVGT